MKIRSNTEIMMRLIKLVKPLSGYMILAIAAGTAGHLCASAVTVSGVLGAVSVSGMYELISWKAAVVVAAVTAVARGILRYCEQTCNHYIAFRLLALLRDRVFRALRELCPAKLEGRDKGNLISLITSDIELLEVFYAHTISPAAIAILFSGAMTVFIGAMHPLLGLIALVSYLAVGAGIPAFISAAGGNSGNEFRKAHGRLSSYVLDSLRGLQEIIQYGNGSERLDEMEKMTEHLSETERKMKRNTGMNTALTGAVVTAADVCMLIAGAALYMNGAIGGGQVIVAVTALMSSFGPVIALADLGSTLQSTFAAGNRVLDILDEIPVTEEISDGENVEFSGAAAENLSFSYGDEKILEDLSLAIPENSITGITGRSGSGKSTFLKLLMRFWNADEGRITISGKDINTINTASLRSIESFVTQDTHIFHDSIRNNLLIAKPDATDDEIREACRKASVDEFIMNLPKGYDTQAGELGDSLSGGEKQRIGLARAFLHNSSLMLLDEPTSNLDSLNEAAVLKAINEERDNRTVILVSHRESTMRIADRFFSAENGRIS